MLLPKRQARFESRSQSWSTPQALFERLDEEFHFTIDLAADSTNAKCPIYYTAEDDALAQEWKGVCWLNPPFNSDKARLRCWVKKAFESDCVVVMLIPAHTNTNWWHDYCMRAAEIVSSRVARSSVARSADWCSRLRLSCSALPTRCRQGLARIRSE